MEIAIPFKTKKLSSDKLFWVTVAGFLLRIALLIFMLTVGRQLSDPYFIADDIKYENLAKIYMQRADFFIDFSTFDAITTGYLELFWPFVVCVSGYIFRTVYAGRFLNILLSSLCIPLLYNISFSISENKRTAFRTAMIFAFMPVTIITCCFPIKDIFITFAVLFAFNTFLSFYNRKKVPFYITLVTASLLLGAYYSRGAITEFLLIVFLIYIIIRFIKEKNHLAVLISIGVVGVIYLLIGDVVIAEFLEKINDYSKSDSSASSALSFRITSFTQIYKLPLTYFTTSLQPMRTNIFSVSSSMSFWLNILTYTNITIYPIAIGNFLYIFKKKKNLFFWFWTLVIYCAIIIFSPGVFRHYLFMLPIHFVNFSLFIEDDEQRNFIICAILSVILLMGILLLSMINL